MGQQPPGLEPSAASPDHLTRALHRQHRVRSSLALRNWRVTWRLVALIAIPTVMGLLFGVLRITAADGAARQFSQAEQLALLGQQTAGLAQAVEDERDLTAGYVAARRPAAMLTRLEQQYTVTAAWAARVRSLAAGIGAGYPVQAQNSADVVLAMLNNLSEVRGVLQTGDTAAMPMVMDYSALLSDLLSFNDQIAQGSGDAVLADTVRTLGSLAQMKDDASLQRAILYAALLEGRFELGATAQITSAQASQATDLSHFETSATLAQQESFNNLTAVDPGMATEQELGQLAVRGDSPADLGVLPDQWYTTMSGTIGRMRADEEQLVATAVAQSKALQQGAAGSALLTSVLSLTLLLIASIATFIVARSMVRPLRALRSDALEVARVRLPEKVRELSNAEDPGANAEVAPISVDSVDEIGQVARAFDQVHREAVRLAGNEAMLRNSMNAMFVSLSWRSQSVLERLVRLVDSLEQSEEDPGRLSDLFAVDHLVTRMRRHSENLLVLAGHETARKRTEPAALADVVRAAVSEILEYDRVVVDAQPGVTISGQSVSDIAHLLAEIIENATRFSAKDTRVQVSGHVLDSGGVLIDVTDQGVGIPAEQLDELNWRLDNPPVPDVSVSRHMGLFAVSHLAARHGVRVRLRHASPSGLTALVWIPETLIAAEVGENAGWPAPKVAGQSGVVGSGGWPVSSLHRSKQEVLADRPIRPAEPMPIYEAVASEWFRREGRVPLSQLRRPGAGEQVRANWGSPADAGWYAAESAAAPVRGELTAAGLPQRIPRANVVPGSVGEGSPSAGERAVPVVPAGPRRSADVARARLTAFQRGIRRAESAAGSPAERRADG